MPNSKDTADQAAIAALVLPGPPGGVVAHAGGPDDGQVGAHRVDQPDEAVVQDVDLVVFMLHHLGLSWGLHLRLAVSRGRCTSGPSSGPPVRSCGRCARDTSW